MWNLITKAWDSDSDECLSCTYRTEEHASDTGRYAYCRLLEDGIGKPHYCPAFDRLTEETEDDV